MAQIAGFVFRLARAGETSSRGLPHSASQSLWYIIQALSNARRRMSCSRMST